MEDGRLVVVVFDFRATCFTLLSFIEVALKKPRDRFCQSVIERIEYPHQQSNDAKVLLSASFGTIRNQSVSMTLNFVVTLGLIFSAVQHSHWASLLD